jgi:hypothetical protein
VITVILVIALSCCPLNEDSAVVFIVIMLHHV